MMDERLKACIKNVSFEEAKKLLRNYTYVLIYEISRICLEKAENVAEINWDVCRELYAFGNGNQLHLFLDDETEEMKAVEFCPVDLNYVDRKYALNARFADGSKNVLVVREYLCADKDGQTYVGYTALQTLVEGGEKDE